MLKSMTGYGRVNIQKEEREYQVEIRSVNYRYLDISVKMPKQLSYLEEDVKKEIAKKIRRGKVEVFIVYNNSSVDGINININKELAKAYIKELKELALEENISSDICVNDIAKYPDVLTIQKNEEDQRIKEELIEAVGEATNSLYDMRVKEGKQLSQDFLERLGYIKNKINEISSLSTGLIQEYVVKLEGRIKQLLQDKEIDKDRLAQEVVIFADKCSVEEEITRLDSHIKQFRELINSDKPIGKKLDFLIQEMNRETNTIGSKANNLEITNNVVDLKTEIENIREQVQNIE